MRRLPIALALVCLAAAAGCSSPAPLGNTERPPAPPWEATLARQATLTGLIRDMRYNSAMSPAALIERLARADFVLLGERHDNPDHHRLQAWIVERLLARRPYAVAFEMIGADQADKLAAYLAASPKVAAGLGDALEWNKSGWPSWSYYAPIASAAMARGMPILAANLPVDLARAMAQGGLMFLPPDLYGDLKLDRPAQNPAERAILDAHRADIQVAHCGLLPERALAPFALVQYTRDAHMARVIVDRRPIGGGVILIAGAGHVRTDRGVPHHLAWFAPDAHVAAVAFVEAEETRQEASAASPPMIPPYDILWFTARVDSGDGCDKMIEQMELRKKTEVKN